MVGWSSADLLRTEPVAGALGSACRERRPVPSRPARPVIFHSDRGCQYTGQQSAAVAMELGVRLPAVRNPPVLLWRGSLTGLSEFFGAQ